MPLTPRRWVLPVLVLFVFSSAGAAPPPPLPVTEPDKFVRYVDERGGGRLETAVVTYRNEAGVEVKLVSAIHIGESDYFEGLMKDFDTQDAVLYELVKEKDEPVPAPDELRRKQADAAREGKQQHPIGQLQRFLKDTLNLDYQLDVIDYTKKNFVHADMDREAFEKAQAERGESFETIMLQQLMSAMRRPVPGQQDPAQEDPEKMLRELIAFVTRPDMERQLKTVVARQMDQMQDVAMGLDGPGGSVILTERNKAAVKVLEEQVKAGKRKISIFYGAAHMPDLAKRVREMGFKPAGKTEWKRAWDLRIRDDKPSAIEQLFGELMKALEESPALDNAEERVW